jgi:hypothetical protein
MAEVGAGGFLLFEEVAGDDAADTVFEDGCIEVHQQPERAALEFQVGEKLGVMYGEKLGDGFEFDDKLAFDDEIQTVAAIELHSFVEQGHLALALEGEASLSEFVSEGFLIGRFKQAGPEFAVNLHAQADDAVTQFV